MVCVGVLRRWQDRYPYDATHHCLACALQHPAVGRVDLAAKYCVLQLGKDDVAVLRIISIYSLSDLAVSSIRLVHYRYLSQSN